MLRNAMLAIWSDVAAEHETDYLHWLTREHTTERVSTPGFVAVRVFRSIRSDVRRYFISYDLENPNVVNDPAYVAKLNNPTPWSQRIMPRLGNFRRGGGGIGAAAGVGQGGFVAPIILAASVPEDIGTIVESLARLDAVAAVRFLEVDQARTSVQTREKSMRANDQSFAGLILVEALHDASLRAALSSLSSRVGGEAIREACGEAAYQHVFSLHRDMLRMGEH